MIALWLLLAAQPGPLGTAALPDPVLADQRGGFRLPSGINVAITVQTQTVLDGAIVLRTVFRADEGAPTFTIMAPATGQTVSAGRNTAVSTASRSAAMPTVTYDRNGGLQVVPGVVMPQVSVTSGGAQGTASTGEALATVVPGASTDNGVVSAATQGGLRTVTLASSDLTITHIAGNAFGSAILNMGSDRAIDTQTSVAIDLSNTGPDVLGSTMFKIQDVAINAAALRAN